MKGTVKRIVRDKGFGFIADENGTEYFFHRSSVHGIGFDSLQEGQKANFETEDSAKGPRARDVDPK